MTDELDTTAPRPRIAILGSAPTSLHLTPWEDPSYQIWGCSGASHPVVKRFDAWFELHDFDSCVRLWTPEYVQFLKASTKPVYMHEPHAEIPASVALPKDDLIATFGRFFWTSSIAWMLGHALTLNPEEIALYGIDMSEDGEFATQRAGCQHFMTLALMKGIKVTVPPESCIQNASPMYGCAPRNPLTVQAIAHNDRIAQTLESMQQAYQDAAFQKKYWEGYADCNTYWLRTLEQDPKSVVGG